MEKQQQDQAGSSVGQTTTTSSQGKSPYQTLADVLTRDGYKIDTVNGGVIKDLADYFGKSPEMRLNPKKGIYLHGSIGCGKTFLMKLISQIVGFRMVSTRRVVNDYAENGHEVIRRYGRESFKRVHRGGGSFPDRDQPLTICFDDFGDEPDSKFYGQNVNVMNEIMMDRYEQFQDFGMITHVTTNYYKSETIEKMYGPRLLSRISEMMNIVHLPGQDRRK